MIALKGVDKARRVSPLFNISEKTCPVVLIHGESDQTVSPSHSEKFYIRMQEFGRKCELFLIEKTNHAFLLAEYSKELIACKMGIAIIEQYLICEKM